MYKEERPWLVIHTFNKREMDVSEFLREKNLVHFIPMHYKERFYGYDQKPKRVLVPIIHNYVFVQVSMPVNELKTLLAECHIPLHLLHEKNTNRPSEISNQEMFEFRMLCDPKFEQQVSIKADTDDLPIGKDVEVIHGPFAGIKGRLVRKQKKYWFVKTFIGICVEIRITRWFCKPVNIP